MFQPDSLFHSETRQSYCPAPQPRADTSSLATALALPGSGFPATGAAAELLGAAGGATGFGGSGLITFQASRLLASDAVAADASSVCPSGAALPVASELPIPA